MITSLKKNNTSLRSANANIDVCSNFPWLQTASVKVRLVIEFQQKVHLVFTYCFDPSHNLIQTDMTSASNRRNSQNTTTSHSIDLKGISSKQKNTRLTLIVVDIVPQIFQQSLSLIQGQDHDTNSSLLTLCCELSPKAL